jgi:hypothetical protein
MPFFEVKKNDDGRIGINDEYQSLIVLSYSDFLDTNGETMKVTSRKDFLILFSLVKQMAEKCKEEIYSNYRKLSGKSLLNEVTEINFKTSNREDAGNYSVTIAEKNKSEIIGDIIVYFMVGKDGKLKWGVFSDDPKRSLIIVNTMLSAVLMKYVSVLTGSR